MLVQTTRVGGKLFFPDKASAEYLDGSYAGDLGFDPLGLLDPEGAGGFISPEWLRYGEIINGRWAMLGCAGCIAPEFLGKAGLIPEATNVIWWKSGVIPPVGTPDGLYWADPWAIFFIEVVLMQFAELRRWQDYKNPGSMGEQYFLGLEGLLKGSGEPAYPGMQQQLLLQHCIGPQHPEFHRQRARTTKLLLFSLNSRLVASPLSPSCRQVYVKGTICSIFEQTVLSSRAER